MIDHLANLEPYRTTYYGVRKNILWIDAATLGALTWQRIVVSEHTRDGPPSMEHIVLYTLF